MQNHPPLGGLRPFFYVNVKLCHADFVANSVVHGWSGSVADAEYHVATSR